MHEFRDIFSDQYSWKINKSIVSGFVEGIQGDGNGIFDDIKNSINKYLGSMAGSVIDFQLLKDAVDRHCETVEDDINTQTPVPLYLGLAGTMAGVILGLGALLMTGAIGGLLSGTSGVGIGSAADGINELLSGVALAMVASICGIVFTTLNSLLFKRCKLEEESGKNTFIAWMQSKLLPELPSDTSAVMNKLVKNLNRFNNQFTQNISVLSQTFDDVNKSYQTQAEIIKTVQKMDVLQMAQANVKVLKQLQECTDKLELFNEYIDKIDEFNYQFSQQAETQDIFKDISTFFNRYKSSISSLIGDTDDNLKTAMRSLNDNSAEQVAELKNRLTEQSEQFKIILNEERDSFLEFSKSLKAEFESKMQQLPTIAQSLDKISTIPAQLDGLASRIDKSNIQMANHLDKFLQKLPVGGYSDTNNAQTPVISRGMRIFIIAALSVVVLSSVANTILNSSFMNSQQPNEVPSISDSEDTVVTNTAVDTVHTDSIKYLHK
jgi:hypothetical protein